MLMLYRSPRLKLVARHVAAPHSPLTELVHHGGLAVWSAEPLDGAAVRGAEARLAEYVNI
jgi:hypothetical protein